MKTSIMTVALAAALPVLALGARDASTRWNADKDGVVLGGFDVVAYHTQGQAVRGSSAMAVQYEGGTFLFSTREHRAAFEKEPRRYAPQFGGFCAFGVAVNKAKVPVDPATFKIQDGKLLLFFNDLYEGKKVNTRLLWEEKADKLYRDAVAVWPTLE